MSCGMGACVSTYIQKCNLKIQERLEGRKEKEERGREGMRERERGRDRLP